MPANKLKQSVLFLMLAMAAVLVTACDSDEQKAQNAEWEAQASENALVYHAKK